jgi:NagD protein
MDLRTKSAFILDMDGVVYHGNKLLDGALDFVKYLKDSGKKFLFLTNSSERSPADLRNKLLRLGLDIEPEHFYTSALATASFLASAKPGCSAYVIGEPGLVNALYNAGISMNDADPDYVVVGETRAYNIEKIERAVTLVLKGARLVGANPDITGPVEGGIAPATGALIAPIELASGRKAYFVGKPNPLMMRHALKRIDSRREDTVIIGDRMDTDIIAGIESEIDTVLVLSGVSSRGTVAEFAYRPKMIRDNLAHVLKTINGETLDTDRA